MKQALAALLCLAGMGAGLSAWAQTPEPTVYRDRLIEGLATPEPGDADSEEAIYNREGWARNLRFETRLGTDPLNNGKTSAGLAFYGLIETPNYGVLSADLSATPNTGHQALTLRQRGLPVDGGWRVNNEAGVIGTPLLSINRTVSRVYVPGTLVEGLSTEWANSGSGLQWQASTGQPGRLEGSPTSGFRGLAGRVSSAGAQLDTNPWQMAARVTRADRVSLLDAPTLATDFFNAESAQLTVHRAKEELSLQANLISTRASNVAGQHNGFWLDGEWKYGAGSHAWGVYWLDTNLSWAGQPMASDTSGAYVRTNWRTRQWSAEGGVDLLRSVSNRSQTGVFVTGSLRGRYSRDVSFGAGASVRHFNGDAWSTYADTRWQNDWGSSSLRLNLSNELSQTHSRAVTLDHDWLVPTSWSLSTSLTGGHETTSQQSYNRWAAAVSMGAPLSASTLVRGNLNTERTSAGVSQSSANLSVNWRINPFWSLDSSYNYARGQNRGLLSIDPLAPPVILPLLPNSSHSVLVVLRYEDRAGSRSVPLGGRPLEGGGRIEGTVFLDANRNARQEASETGAPGVTVYLDSLYTVRTDTQGRFEFPFVSAGTHVITVLNETLPLPWVAAGDGRTSVEVRVREDLRLAIGMVRQGGD